MMPRLYRGDRYVNVARIFTQWSSDKSDTPNPLGIEPDCLADVPSGHQRVPRAQYTLYAAIWSSASSSLSARCFIQRAMAISTAVITCRRA